MYVKKILQNFDVLCWHLSLLLYSMGVNKKDNKIIKTKEIKINPILYLILY